MLELENFVLHNILESLVNFSVQSGVNEVVKLRVELTFSSEFSHVIEFIKVFIIWVLLKVSFEVISILLLFFSKSTKEESIVFIPSLIFALKQSAFTTIVIYGVIELSTIELLDSVEVTVENTDVLLHLVPLFVLTSSVRSRQVSSLSGHLLINSFVSKVHGVQFLVGLSDSF